MISKVKKSPLFFGMSDSNTENCLKRSRSEIVSYEEDELIFHQRDIPRELLVLLEGAVVVGNDSSSGKRNIMTTLDQPRELSGEVFLFLNKQGYDHYVQAVIPVQILQTPRDFLYNPYGENCSYRTELISNILSILAQKTYCLNRKLQIVSRVTLRQKIAKVLLQDSSPDGRVTLSMNREGLAGFMNTARPSLSRELMKMQEDGITKIEKQNIRIVDFDASQNN